MIQYLTKWLNRMDKWKNKRLIHHEITELLIHGNYSKKDLLQIRDVILMKALWNEPEAMEQYESHAKK